MNFNRPMRSGSKCEETGDQDTLPLKPGSIVVFKLSLASSFVRKLSIFILALAFFHTPAFAQSQTIKDPESLTQELTAVQAELENNPKDRDLLQRLAVLYSNSVEHREKAKPIFEQLVKQHEDTDSLMGLASCYYRLDYEEEFRLCQKANRLNNGKSYTKAMTLLGMADARYRQGQLQVAEQLYKQSLSALSERDVFPIAKLDLSGLGGVYWRLKDFEKSADAYMELYKLAKAKYGANDIDCGWACLQTSYALAKAGKTEQVQEWFERAIWIFRKDNVDRIIEEYKQTHDNQISQETVAYINNSLFGNKIGIEPKDPITEGESKYKNLKPPSEGYKSPWKKKFKQTEAPGWVWFDPSAKFKSILLCVHGLGLHHKAFESFAKRIAPEGIMTIAFDVQGFGTYTEANGLETLSMEDCVNDLKNIFKLLRRDYPDTPIFLLGESMGGALALRIAAESPEIFDGLICSVPSGNRYKSFATKLRIGVDFLKNKSKPVPVGDVVEQATTDEGLRHSWIHDPSSRLNLSPKELLNFQRFMNENAEVAKKVRDLPVIIFQGHDDKLVKEAGTLDLFEALSTRDKTIVILGGTEHLIFEAGQFKDDMTLGVLGWMSAHGHEKKTQKPGTSSNEL